MFKFIHVELKKGEIWSFHKYDIDLGMGCYKNCVVIKIQKHNIRQVIL